jgi:hypothetical protein
LWGTGSAKLRVGSYSLGPAGSATAAAATFRDGIVTPIAAASKWGEPQLAVAAAAAVNSQGSYSSTSSPAAETVLGACPAAAADFRGGSLGFAAASLWR